MSQARTFSPDYVTARQRFRQALDRLGWRHEAHPIAGTTPAGEDLTIDVGYSTDSGSEKVLVVSSGVHGVEGFFGSAVQLELLERWPALADAGVKCVLLHALNPAGFANLRRVDDNNVDPNRNFLLPGEPFAGSPTGYAQLDSWLNPRRPPSPWEPFTIRAIWNLARYGNASLRQIVAGGQYDFPQGLFYGGCEPSQMQKLLHTHLPRWLHGSRTVAHLDFHTGLGQSGSWKLLIDYPLSDRQRALLTDWFGPDSFEESGIHEIAYDTRGSFDRWCVAHNLAPEYLFACAEFGTFSAFHILAGLCAENQATHWAAPGSTSIRRTRQRLKDLFCPTDEAWRSQVLEGSLDLITRTIHGLSSVSPTPILQTPEPTI